jgi:hypothetical protein
MLSATPQVGRTTDYIQLNKRLIYEQLYIGTGLNDMARAIFRIAYAQVQYITQ